MDKMHGFYCIHERDNVATALEDVPVGPAALGGAVQGRVEAAEAIPFGHKIALRSIAQGGEIIKYGCVIGTATADIPAGRRVDERNCVSRVGITEAQGVYRPGARAVYTLEEGEHV